MRGNRKGLSTIVSTLLILLLVFVAVGILWSVVRTFIQSGSEEVSLGKFTLDLQIDSVAVNDTNNTVYVKVQRNVGTGNFSALKFVFSDDSESESIVYNQSLLENEKLTFSFILSKLNVSNLVTVEVIPIFTLSSGKTSSGDVKDTYYVKEGYSVRITSGSSSTNTTTNTTNTTAECTVNSDCNDDSNGTTDTCSLGVCYNTAITQCINGDSYCPSGCDSSNDSDCVGCITDSECNDGDSSTIDICTLGVCQNTKLTTCTNNDGVCPAGCTNSTDNDCSSDLFYIDSRCRDIISDRALNILFIGNSFTGYGDIYLLVKQLATDGGWISPSTTKAVIYGASLSDHRNSSYTLGKVDTGNWDVVVLQDYSNRPTSVGDPAGFKDDVAWFYDRIKASSPNATIVLYETFAYPETNSYIVNYFGSSAAMQSELRSNYNDAAYNYVPAYASYSLATDITVAPVGDAWEQEFLLNNPLTLHIDGDYHPNDYGSYLNALMIYATIYQTDTLGVGNGSLIDSTNATHLQNLVDNMNNYPCIE